MQVESQSTVVFDIQDWRWHFPCWLHTAVFFKSCGQLVTCLVMEKYIPLWWLVFNSKGITSMKKAINNCLKAIICGRTSFLRGDCKHWNHFHPYQKCLNYYKNTQGWILESFIWSKTINFNVVILSECHCKNFGVRQVVKQPLGLVGWSPWICPNTSSLAADCSNYGLNLA